MNRREFIKSSIVTIVALVLPSFKRGPIVKESKWANFGERLRAALDEAIRTNRWEISGPVGGGYKVPEEHAFILNEWISGRITDQYLSGAGCYVEFQPRAFTWHDVASADKIEWWHEEYGT